MFQQIKVYHILKSSDILKIMCILFVDGFTICDLFKIITHFPICVLLLQGGGSSPIGHRSTSPIDISSISGSPRRSPATNRHPLPSIGSVGSVSSITGVGSNEFSVGTFGSVGSPSFSSDLMISAGGVTGSTGGNTQMDLGLSKEFQRFTMVSHAMIFVTVVYFQI